MSNNTIEITHRDNRKWIDKLTNPEGKAKGYLQLKIPALHAYFQNLNNNDDNIGYYSGISFKRFTDKSYSFERKEIIIGFYPLFYSFTIFECDHLSRSNKQLFDDLRNIAIFLDIKCNREKGRNKEVFKAFQTQVAIMKRVLPNEVIKEGIF
jgi:hypothetical protein